MLRASGMARNFSCRVLIAAFLWLSLSNIAAAQKTSCRPYVDGNGRKVFLHPRAFVDRTVCPGQPTCTNEVFRISGKHNVPENAVGPPTYRSGYQPEGRTIYSLGCRGWAIWEFVDNVIVDVPGPDIFVFEVGKAIEATTVEISEDGVDWIDVGVMQGSHASIDIEKFVQPDQRFRFIKLTDLGSSCRNPTAGADIDAIAAFGYAWVHVEDDSSIVFFDFARSELKPEARALLERLVSGLAEPELYRLQIDGHTDSIGSDEDNNALSERRTAAVADFVNSLGRLEAGRITTYGWGETRPVASNETPAGRAKNRRVELTFIPIEPCGQPITAD